MSRQCKGHRLKGVLKIVHRKQLSKAVRNEREFEVAVAFENRIYFKINRVLSDSGDTNNLQQHNKGYHFVVGFSVGDDKLKDQ